MDLRAVLLTCLEFHISSIVDKMTTVITIIKVITIRRIITIITIRSITMTKMTITIIISVPIMLVS